MQKLITITDGVARQLQFRLRAPLNIELADRPTAIVGANGAGKSIFVDTLTGKHPLVSGEITYDFTPSHSQRPADNIKVVTFHDTYGDTTEQTYYQQRWNQGVESESRAPTVGELIKEALHTENLTPPQLQMLQIFGIERLLDHKIFMLSSGELRRFQITLMLLSKPRVLIVDNPFIGLDAEARRQVAQVLERLAHTCGLTLMLVLARHIDVPRFVEQVVCVEGGVVSGPFTLADYRASFVGATTGRELDIVPTPALPVAPNNDNEAGSDVVIGFHHIYIRYGRRCILHDLNWTVKRGEKWALCGANGSGKSTLLSLVCADNPQAYACDIELFGRRRGSGESIWDIKKNIGYVSPEMYRAYRRNVPAIDIVASGLHDSAGLYRRTTPADRQTALAWMQIFGIATLADRSYLTLSSGEQRLVLLARAFVKDPALLILDEPFHGLDDEHKQWARSIIEAFCRREGKTLVMVSHYEEDFPPAIDHRLTLQLHDKEAE